LSARDKEGFNVTLLDVKRIADVLALPPEVSRRAGAICADAASIHFGQEFSHQALASAALYVGCRESQRPLTLKDLAGASGSDPRVVGRCYMKILQRMHIARPELKEDEYVYHLALKRPVSEQALKLSREIIDNIVSKGLGGRNPMTLAAASLYIACCNMGENVTQAEVAEAAGVGEQSVRDCCKEIRLLARQPS